RNGAAHPLLGAFDRAVRHGFLRRRSFPALEGRPFRRCAEGPAAGAPQARRREGGEGGADAAGRDRPDPRCEGRAGRIHLSPERRESRRAGAAGALMAHLSSQEKDRYAKDGYVVPAWRFPERRISEMRAALDELIASNPGVRPEKLVSAHLENGSEGVKGSRAFLEM